MIAACPSTLCSLAVCLLTCLLAVNRGLTQETAANGDSTAKAAAKTEKAAPKKSEKATIALVTIKGSLPESAGQIGLFGEMEVNLGELVGRLDRAATDNSISGIVLRIRNPAIGPGKTRELREVISRVRKAGKKVTAQLESATTADYLVASACDEIIMPESGEIMIPGHRVEVMFYKGLFDLVGIQADMMQVGDFKGAAEPFTRQQMSPEFRKQYESVLDDLYQQTVEMIAADRKLDPDKVRKLIDVGIFMAADAKAAGLIDEVVYDDELKGRLQKSLSVDKLEISENYGKKKVNTDFSGMTGMFELFNLMMGVQPTQMTSSNKKLAVIYASGVIMPGESTASLFGGQVMGSDTMVKAIRQAEEDKTVVAIVLRVDSPGGSALASDHIWRAIQKCEKPVIASMGDVAGSGGYYISMGCDKIFAESGTITGSIGVVGGKMVLKGLYDKMGLSTDVISRGENSGLLSDASPFSDSERAVWKKMMEEVYRQFLTKAAAGRKMEVAKLETLAGGRIWTGRQAKANGLVDEVGTLRDAITEAKKLAGQNPSEKMELLVLPKAKSIFEQLIEGDVGAATPAGLSRGFATSETLSALAEIHQIERLFRERNLFLMPNRIKVR